MEPIGRTLRGSTLVETLVMMLVAGIVFLAMTEGLALFGRLQAQCVGALLRAGVLRNGYFRTEALLAAADSVRFGDQGPEVFRGNGRSRLVLRDSALLWSDGACCDTLFSPVAGLGWTGGDGRADTLEVRFPEGLAARFPVRVPLRAGYAAQVKEIEKGYDYEEKCVDRWPP